VTLAYERAAKSQNDSDAKQKNNPFSIHGHSPATENLS
jgi:hypothetical protein